MIFLFPFGGICYIVPSEGKVEMSFSSRIACEGNHGQSHSQAVHGVAFGMAVAMLQLLAIVSLMTVSQPKWKKKRRKTWNFLDPKDDGVSA